MHIQELMFVQSFLLPSVMVAKSAVYVFNFGVRLCWDNYCAGAVVLAIYTFCIAIIHSLLLAVHPCLICKSI